MPTPTYIEQSQVQHEGDSRCGLELAGEAGVKFAGVLCGRATWKDGIPVHAKEGVAAFRKWLQTEGVKNINNVNDRLKAASPWYASYGVSSVEALAHA